MTDEHNEQAPVPAGRGRRTFLVMLGIGFVPLFLAYAIFFFFPQFAPTGTTNEGALIQPPLAIAAMGNLERDVPGGKWTFLVPAPGDCDTRCENAIYLARQVNIGVGKDSDRVQRVLIVGTVELSEDLRQLLRDEYADMLVHRDVDRLALAVFASAVQGDRAPADLAGLIFLADPNGNIILYFDEAAGGKPILHDLKHLLRLSNIG